MPSLTPKTQIDKAKHALRDAVAYADEVVRDERLRADIRAAVGHGTKASDRLKKEIDAGGISARLTSDTKLRKNLRAMLDDLDSAGQRMQRKKGHRARSVLLVIAGAGAVWLLLAAYATCWHAPGSTAAKGALLRRGRRLRSTACARRRMRSSWIGEVELRANRPSFRRCTRYELRQVRAMWEGAPTCGTRARRRSGRMTGSPALP